MPKGCWINLLVFHFDRLVKKGRKLCPRGFMCCIRDPPHFPLDITRREMKQWGE
jgi:hypothetical protein